MEAYKQMEFSLWTVISPGASEQVNSRWYSYNVHSKAKPLTLGNGWQADMEWIFIDLWVILASQMTVHSNMTSTGPEWQNEERERAEFHLNMPNQCHVNSENYYCAAYSYVWKGAVMACHLQLLRSERGMGRTAVANFVCTGFFPLKSLALSYCFVSKKDCSGNMTFRKHGWASNTLFDN